MSGPQDEHRAICDYILKFTNDNLMLSHWCVNVFSLIFQYFLIYISTLSRRYLNFFNCPLIVISFYWYFIDVCMSIGVCLHSTLSFIMNVFFLVGVCLSGPLNEHRAICDYIIKLMSLRQMAQAGYLRLNLRLKFKLHINKQKAM